MHQISTVSQELQIAGIAFTPSLRELFSRTHAVMSESDPSSLQYPPDEQFEMFLVCEGEDDVLELLQHLYDKGVRAVNISPYIRLYSALTKSVAIRLNAARFRKKNEEKERKSHSGVFNFQAPAYAGSRGAVA